MNYPESCLSKYDLFPKLIFNILFMNKKMEEERRRKGCWGGRITKKPQSVIEGDTYFLVYRTNGSSKFHAKTRGLAPVTGSTVDSVTQLMYFGQSAISILMYIWMSDWIQASEFRLETWHCQELRWKDQICARLKICPCEMRDRREEKGGQRVNSLRFFSLREWNRRREIHLLNALLPKHRQELWKSWEEWGPRIEGWGIWLESCHQEGRESE